MTTPVYDEQFLPRLVAIFFATFHPTEGPKVVYQVPEGTIAQDCDPSEIDSDESLDSEDEGDNFRENIEKHARAFEDFNPDQETGRSSQQPSQQPSLPSVDEVTTPSAASSLQPGFPDLRPPLIDQEISSVDSEPGPGASEFTVLRDQGVSSFTIRDQAASSGLSSLDTLSLPVISSSSSGSDSDESDYGIPGRSNRRRFSRDSQGRPQVRASSEASKATSAYSAAASYSRLHRSTNGSRPPEPLFDFSPLAEYVIPKAPLCGKLVTCTTRGRTSTTTSEEAGISLRKARSRARSGKSVSHSGSRTSSVAPSSSRYRSSPVSPTSSSHDLPRQNETTTGANSTNPSSTRSASSSYKILSHPVLIDDPKKYARNTYIFNIGFVFDGRADTRAYEPVVRKCARVVRGLEEATSFLSNPASTPRMYGIIEQLFEDLNSYCESFVALPDTPHTNWIQKQLQKNKASRENHSTRHDSNASANSLNRPDLASRAASISSSGSELPNPQLKEDARNESRGRLFSQSSHASSKGSNAALIALLTQTPSSLSRRASTEVLGNLPTDAISDLSSPLSPTSGYELSSSSTSSSNSQSTASLSVSRPSIGRSTTATAITNATVTTATAQSGGERGEVEQSSKMANDVTASQDYSSPVDLSQEKSAIGQSMSRDKSNITSAALPKAGNTTPLLASSVSVSTAAPNRVTSGGSTTSNGIELGSSNLSESILSLRTIGAASEKRAPPTTAVSGAEVVADIKSSLDNAGQGPGLASNDASTNQSQSQGVSLPGRRDPPHGLGRTVRDAINLKLFPTYANPPPVNDWDVPVALLRLEKMIDANWDLTMARVCPFIDGVNHIKRIAQMADADLELTRQCMEHLIYYGCIILTDLFQFFNMYTVRPLISRMAADPVVRQECSNYVTRPGYAAPSYPTLLRLYSLFRPGLTVHEWIEENEAEIDLDSMGIDVRRFASFGVIKGFLRRVHRYPILLSEEFDAEDENSNRNRSQERGRDSNHVEGEVSGVSTSRSGSALERVKGGGSGSREREYKAPLPRGHRDSDTPAMSGFDLRSKSNSRSRERKENSNLSAATPPPPRLRREASETESVRTIHEPAHRARLPSNRTSSWDRSDSPHTQQGTSPTKRNLNRPSTRSKKPHRHPTATVVDVATIALEQLNESQARHSLQSRSGGAGGIPLQAQGRTSSFKRINSTAYPPSPSKRASFSNLPISSGDFNQSRGTPTSRIGIESRNGEHNGFPRSTSFGPEAAQSSVGFDTSRAFTSLPIPPELPELLDGTHCDDELCVRFGLSWSELQKMLIVVGTSPNRTQGPGRSGSGDRDGNYSDDELNRDFGTDNNQSVSAFTSGYGNVSSASGYIRRSFPKSKRSSNALRGASGNAATTTGGKSSSGWTGVRVNSSGWNAESEGAMNSGWASSGGSSLDQKALERGDYGKVKIILR